MHTTLYRSLALLVSIFALTSSFSLSTETGNTKSQLSKDQVPWVFEYTWGDNLAQFERFENGSSVVDTKYNFETDLKPELQKYSINKEKLHSVFKIYKNGRKEKIIGFVLKHDENEGELILYSSEALYSSTENRFKPLDISDRLVSYRKVDLSKDKLFTGGYCSEDGGYVFDINWLKIHRKKWKCIKVNDNESGQLEMVDQKESNPWIFEYTYDQQMFFHLENINEECFEKNNYFREKLTKYSKKFYKKGKKLYYAFRIYRESKENKIIGIVLRDEKCKADEGGELMLYDNEFNPLKDEYTKSIKNKTLVSEYSYYGPFSHRFSPNRKDRYVLGMGWEKENKKTEKTSITLFYDDNDEIVIKENIPKISTSREKWKEILRVFLILGLCIYIIGKLYIDIYRLYIYIQSKLLL